ncbi:MAG: histidine kinase, partial [Actinomycetota bacterium]|nr:histidine kinase [Actinomycetota bacterium]
SVLGIGAGLVFTALDSLKLSEQGRAGSSPLSDLGFILGFITFPVVGYVMASRRPDNNLSWVILDIGAAVGLGAVTGSYGTYAVHGGIGGFRIGTIVIAVDGPMWMPVVALPVTFLLLLFPDGHLPSPRWKWFARILGAGLAIVFLSILLFPGKLEATNVPKVQNPLGIEALRPVLSAALILLVLLPVGVIASLVSLIQRFRRSTGIERLQLRWLATAASIVGILYALALVIGFNDWLLTNATAGWLTAIQNIAIASFGLIPIAIAVSVLRYHLFDIDLVINRALLFGALGLFITAVYVAVVVGIGTLVGNGASPVLSAAAAAIVAIAFGPARRRAQHLADRLVYGERATPYEVLSQFSERLGNAYASDELLPRMAAALAHGTGAARADVWVRVGSVLQPEAAWPHDAEPPPPLTVADVEEAVTSASILEPVRHQDELLGALSVEKKPGDSVKPAEEKLVRDLAGQVGLVMRNVRLIEELRASRQRLVAAQDEERRRLERNLHDGAQQQLVALAVQLRLLEQMAGKDTEKERELASRLQQSTHDALEQLRDLARGIYPPLLADKGLVTALEGQARKASVPTEVRSDGVGRYPQDTEAAVYFCVLEALNNIAKYSGATKAEVNLAQSDGHLSFVVTDDGVGFDPDEARHGTGLQGMADRMDAIGGALKIRSRPGDGTAVEGQVPTSPMQV